MEENIEELVNEFSWSKSRMEVFEDCKRKYYYQYYGSWNGWSYLASDNNRELYIMKNLQTIPLWIGKTVHENIRWIIERTRAGKSINLDQVLEKISEKMDYEWYSSSNGFSRDDPKRILFLEEHYYEIQIYDEQKDIAFDRVAGCIERFLSDDIYLMEICDLSISALAIEKIDSFLLGAGKVYVVPDLMLWDGDHIKLYDWKTGARFHSESIDFQLYIYALYCFLTTGISLGSIEAIGVNLNNQQRRIIKPLDKVLLNTIQKICSSMHRMNECLNDPVMNDARIEDFPQTTYTEKCKRCKFRGACLTQECD